MEEKMNRAVYEAVMPRKTAYGVKDTLTISGVGPDAMADLKAAIDAYEAGEKPLEGSKLMAAAGDLAQNSNGLAIFSVGDFVSLFNKILSAMPGAPPELNDVLKDLEPSNAATAVGIIIEDSKMKLRVTMPAAEVAQMAEIFRRIEEAAAPDAEEPVIIREPMAVE
jgi:hypothetical protein